MAKAGGKWSWLREKFPTVPLESDYRAKIDSVLDSTSCRGFQLEDGSWSACLGTKKCKVCKGKAPKIRDLDDLNLKDRYLEVRDRTDELNLELKNLGVELEAYTSIFVERMEEREETSKTFIDGVSLGMSIEPYPQVKDQMALKGWLAEKGLSDLLTLNWQTLKSLVSERLTGEVNEPLPSGVDIYCKPKLTCRGRK